MYVIFLYLENIDILSHSNEKGYNFTKFQNPITLLFINNKKINVLMLSKNDHRLDFCSLMYIENRDARVAGHITIT